MPVYSKRVSALQQYNQDMRTAQKMTLRGKYGRAMMHASRASFGAHKQSLEWESRYDGRRAKAWWRRMEFASLCEEEILTLEAKTVASPLNYIKEAIIEVASGDAPATDLFNDSTVEGMCKRIVDLEGWV